jgi:hypothetical protein
MLPHLRELLAAGKTIDSAEYASALVAAAHESLDKDLCPADYLHSLVVGTSAGYEEAFSAFASSTSVNNSSTYAPLGDAQLLEQLRQYPDASALALVAADGAGDLAKWGDLLPPGTAATIAALARTNAPFVYTVPRGKKAYVFVLVGKDLAGVATLAEWLAHATAVTKGEVRPPH